jgi:hypothetical protein
VKVLLVEPDFRKFSLRARNHAEEVRGKKRKRPDDESLWYPPLGLMKLSTFHKRLGDEVKFVIGQDRSAFKEEDLFSPAVVWDRVYVATLFTFQWKTTIETINFYKDAVGGSIHKIFVGGIMASLMKDEIFEETGIEPIEGILDSPAKINLEGNEVIDRLMPDYSILDPDLYGISDTYYTYTSRGCTRRCQWCGVPKIEPRYVPYIDIKPSIHELRNTYGDKPRLKLMDNNVLASPHLERIVDDLVALGYDRERWTDTIPKKQRVIDFNQGLDARYMNKKTMSLLKRLNIRPMRVAFDNVRDKKVYMSALRLAHKEGVRKFSNYMLYNWKDTPKDLYERLSVNIKLNEKWGKRTDNAEGEIYSYPMRYAPIVSRYEDESSHERDYVAPESDIKKGFLKAPAWTKRFTRNIEIMKGAASGAISPTPSLAWRTIGETFEEFVTNLYMPEELLRNRNRHEKKVYEYEPSRPPGTGKVEDFRAFLRTLFKENPEEARRFHGAVAENSHTAVRKYLFECENHEVKKWLNYYLKN